MKDFFIDAVNHEQYRYFIDCMLEYSESFSLVYFKYSHTEPMRLSCSSVKKLLEPLVIYSEETLEWPGTKTLNEAGHIYLLTMYRADKSAARALYKAGGIFGWNYPKYPMDICFYKNGYAFFESSAHSCWDAIYTSDDCDLNELKRKGFIIRYNGMVDKSQLFYNDRSIVL